MDMHADIATRAASGRGQGEIIRNHYCMVKGLKHKINGLLYMMARSISALIGTMDTTDSTHAESTR